MKGSRTEGLASSIDDKGSQFETASLSSRYERKQDALKTNICSSYVFLEIAENEAFRYQKRIYSQERETKATVFENR